MPPNQDTRSQYISKLNTELGAAKTLLDATDDDVSSVQIVAAVLDACAAVLRASSARRHKGPRKVMTITPSGHWAIERTGT
jgi:hypothetical protein